MEFIKFVVKFTKLFVKIAQSAAKFTWFAINLQSPSLNLKFGCSKQSCAYSDFAAWICATKFKSEAAALNLRGNKLDACAFKIRRLNLRF